jgi:hypothetical protein
MPAPAFWQLSFNTLSVMQHEQIGSISKTGLWQAGIHNSCFPDDLQIRESMVILIILNKALNNHASFSIQ